MTTPTSEDWAAALRSGEYAQAQGSLQTPNGYCCIGVYGKLCGLDFDGLSQDSLEVNGLTEWLEDYELRDRFGPTFSDKFAFLACLNDAGFTFEQIANFIEADIWPEDLDKAADNLTHGLPWE